MDLDGPWSFQMIDLMLPRAIEIELRQTRLQYNAVSAAVGSLFSKEVARQWQTAMDTAQQRVDHSVGKDNKRDLSKAAEEMMAVAQKLGISIPSAKGRRG